MSVESDLVKGIIKLRTDGWRKGILGGGRELGTGSACLLGAVAGRYGNTDAVKLLAQLLRDDCEECKDQDGLTNYNLLTLHNDYHLNDDDIDGAVALLRKALARV